MGGQGAARQGALPLRVRGGRRRAEGLELYRKDHYMRVATEFEERDNDYFRRLLLLLMVGVSAALPLLQLYAPARVSSSVIELLNQINELRVRSEFADKFTLRRMDRANNLCKHSC